MAEEDERCEHIADVVRYERRSSRRYFAGKIVRARYYDDQAFARGEYDLP